MYVYAIKFVPRLSCAVLTDMSFELLGYISLRTAADIVNQGRKKDNERWASSFDNFEGIFPIDKGRTFFFDINRPLYVPRRYLINPPTGIVSMMG